MKEYLDIKFQGDFINYFSKNFINEFSNFYEKHKSLKEEIEKEKIGELFFTKFYVKFSEEFYIKLSEQEKNEEEIDFYNSFADYSRKIYKRYLQSFLIAFTFTKEINLILLRSRIILNFESFKDQSITDQQKKIYYKTLNSMIQLIEENYNKILKIKRYRTFNNFLKDNIKEINKIKKNYKLKYSYTNSFYITITTVPNYYCVKYSKIFLDYEVLEDSLFSEESLSKLLESLKRFYN